MEWNSEYVEYCEIMHMEKTERDQIIFMTGYTWGILSQVGKQKQAKLEILEEVLKKQKYAGNLISVRDIEELRSEI